MVLVCFDFETKWENTISKNTKNLLYFTESVLKPLSKTKQTNNE